jgi:hypothetical protein
VADSPYPIIGSNGVGTGLTNYSIGYSSGVLIVNPASLTVVADDKTRMYGLTNPVLTASYNGFVNQEDTNVLNGGPILNTTANPDSPIGDYPITLARGTLDDTNYSFTFDTGTFTITPDPTPVILSIGLTNQVVTVTWGSSAGANYGLQCITNLAGSDWNMVSSNITATGSVTSQTNVTGDAWLQFYRVILLRDGSR